MHYDNYNLHCVISIHALLAESDIGRLLVAVRLMVFLSTLSLRRATGFGLARMAPYAYFYPRSPCGERRIHYDNYNLHCVISIHALLAESDDERFKAQMRNFLFLSTLSLRRATGECC